MLASLPDGAAAGLAEQIGRHGYGELRGLFSVEQIAEARAQAETAAIDGHAGVDGTVGLHGTLLHDLRGSAALAILCRSLFTRLYGGVAPAMAFRQTLRCLSGRSGRRHNLYFHFDSYALTIVVPVAIPPAGPGGDLLLWPDVRGVRRSYLRNVLDKAIADRRPVQYLLGRLARRPRPFVRVRLVPGNLYVFKGYRTLHANEAVDDDALRATIVLHGAPFHEGAASKRLFNRLRMRSTQNMGEGRRLPTH